LFKNCSKYLIFIFVAIALTFYLTLVLWSQFNLKIFGHISFNMIIIFGGIITGLMYPLVNKTILIKASRISILTLSILPWFYIPLLITPYIGQVYLYEIISPTLGLEKVTLYESNVYRFNKIGRVLTGGGQFKYHFVKKHMFYEKVVETWGYPSEIEEKYNKFFVKEN